MFVAGLAFYIDFNVTGDPLTYADDHVSTHCIHGLRMARNIFHCHFFHESDQLRQSLPVQLLHLFMRQEVMHLLVSQERKSLLLGADATVL